jgi:hypothetical protein
MFCRDTSISFAGACVSQAHAKLDELWHAGLAHGSAGLPEKFDAATKRTGSAGLPRAVPRAAKGILAGGFLWHEIEIE